MQCTRLAQSGGMLRLRRLQTYTACVHLFQIWFANLLLNFQDYSVTEFGREHIYLVSTCMFGQSWHVALGLVGNHASAGRVCTLLRTVPTVLVSHVL